jgi:MFS family permease
MMKSASGARHLALGPISFAICFAAWGLISAFAPAFRQQFHLSASETALLVAVPVLLGSLACIPKGVLTDRFGGRSVVGGADLAADCDTRLLPRRTPQRRAARNHYFGADICLLFRPVPVHQPD